ncbi:MAG: DUF6444 domain-containing protein [Pseudonocardiaceae bacterium]
MSPPEQSSPSYEELTALVVDLSAQLERAHARIAKLEARLGRDSTNSSTPPSADSIAAKRRADRSSRERPADRKLGGQPSHRGSGLRRRPSRTGPRQWRRQPSEPAAGRIRARPRMRAQAGRRCGTPHRSPLEKVHYLLPRRRCRCCGKTTTAAPPFGTAGTVAYGPNVNAAAVGLGVEGNVPVERTAMLMAALLGSPMSTGFVRAEEVLCADETPTNVIRKDTDARGQRCPNPRTRSRYAPLMPG